MSIWFIQGGSHSIGLGVDESGDKSIWGNVANSEAEPPSDEFDRDMDQRFDHQVSFYEYLSDMKLSWSISPYGAKELIINRELVRAAELAPTKSHLVLHHWDDRFIGLAIVLPSDLFRDVWDLFLQVLHDEELKYRMLISFPGFKWPHIDIPVPSVSEFRDGIPYITSGVSFSVSR